MLSFSEENYLKSIFHLSYESELGVSTNSIADNLNTKASSNILLTNLQPVIINSIQWPKFDLAFWLLFSIRAT